MSHGFLQDDKGNYSIMRLIVLMIAAVGCVGFLVQLVFWCIDHSTVIHYAELTLFIAPALVSKVAQKITEKGNKKEI